MFTINEDVVKAVKALGWKVREYDTYWEFSNRSPASEDLCEYWDKDTDILTWVFDLAGDFDADEHVEMWVIAQHNGVEGVPHIRTLVKDADAIQEMYNALSDAIRENCSDIDDDYDYCDDEDDEY